MLYYIMVLSRSINIMVQIRYVRSTLNDVAIEKHRCQRIFWNSPSYHSAQLQFPQYIIMSLDMVWIPQPESKHQTHCYMIYSCANYEAPEWPHRSDSNITVGLERTNCKTVKTASRTTLSTARYYIRRSR